MFRLTVVLSFAIMLAGCVSVDNSYVYRADADSQLGPSATVIVPEGVLVYEVDGKDASGGSYFNVKTASQLKLAPGKHVLRYGIEGPYQKFGSTKVWFVAQQARVYVVRFDADFYGFRTWIEDKESGQKVGGVVGSSDEPS